MHMKVGPVVCIVACLLCAGCASIPELMLTQTLELPGTGYTVDYPAGWYVEVIEPLGAAVLSQNKVALAGGIASGQDPPPIAVARGYEVWLQRVSKDLATVWVGIDAPGKPHESARDMLPLCREWSWKPPEDAAIHDVVVAGVNASMAELAPPPSAALFYAVIAGPKKDVYLLRVMAPTTSDLARFRPTWEKMLASIKPVKR
jgi:hypothetical protein